MKTFLAIFVSAVCIVIFAVSADAEQFSFSAAGGDRGAALDTSDEPFASVLSLSPDGSLEALSDNGLAPFIPIQLDQFVINLLDVSKEGDGEEASDVPSLSKFQLNSGIKTESYLVDPKSLFMNELLGTHSDTAEASSSVVFVGVGFDFNSLYLKGNAFVGRPLSTLADPLHTSQGTDRAKKEGIDTDAYGFEASAGYQLSNMVALGASFGKMTDKNHETDETEEVYAVYAQAILAVAPGIQVKPEVGKVDRIKEETDTEEVDEDFYAGAIWEINF